MKRKTVRSLAIAAMMLAFASTSFAYKNSAWIPPWNANALTSLQSNLGVLDESNPVWYGWNADGTIARGWNAENSTWRAAMTGTLLIPTVQNVANKSFDGALAATVLGTPESREAHAEAIAQLTITNAFHGIDIDYERVPTASRANFTAFLTTLAQKLHAANKKLSVSVYAKTSDSQNWNGPGAEDWPAIGQIADSVKIMAYDYSWSTSAPGPITPLNWLDQVTSYAQSVIPNAKIMMALPWYGYDWSSSAPTANMTYATATRLALNNNATISHDANGEATFTFADHVVYFQDATSYAKKVDLLKQRHGSIAGFAAWSAGAEDPAIWNIIRGAGTTPAPATPPAADFSLSGPNTLTITAGSSVSAAYRVVPVNGFSASTTVSVIPPAGFNGTVTADSTTINAGGTVTIRAMATISTLPGVYQFAVRFTSGSLTHDQVVSLTVTQAPRRRVVSR